MENLESARKEGYLKAKLRESRKGRSFQGEIMKLFFIQHETKKTRNERRL
jgi:hypothetical protein